MTHQRRLHENAGPVRLGVVRASVGLMWIAIVAPDPLSFLAALPPSMYDPFGVWALIPHEALTPGVLDGIKAVLLVLLVVFTLGCRPYTPIAVATAVLLTLHQALVREFTFASHEELGLLICTFVLAVFPAADGFAWPRRTTSPRQRAVYQAGLLAMGALLLFPYGAIAAHRIAYGGPELFVSHSFPYFVGQLSSLDRDGWGLGLWLLGQPALVALAKAGFVVTTAFELLAPLALVLPRFRRVWVPVMVAFHLLTWLLFNIFFWQNIVLILLLLTELRCRAARRPRGDRS